MSRLSEDDGYKPGNGGPMPSSSFGLMSKSPEQRKKYLVRQGMGKGWGVGRLHPLALLPSAFWPFCCCWLLPGLSNSRLMPGSSLTSPGPSSLTAGLPAADPGVRAMSCCSWSMPAPTPPARGEGPGPAFSRFTFVLLPCSPQSAARAKTEHNHNVPLAVEPSWKMQHTDSPKSKRFPPHCEVTRNIADHLEKTRLQWQVLPRKSTPKLNHPNAKQRSGYRNSSSKFRHFTHRFYKMTVCFNSMTSSEKEKGS